MLLHLDNTLEGYRNFLRVKALPRYEIRGRLAWFPDEYAEAIGVSPPAPAKSEYVPRPGLFDYQRDIVAVAVERRKFAIFADCGLGKTFMLLEYARHVREAVPDKPVLIVSPLMVVPQTVAECQRFYGDTLPIEVVPAKKLAKWMQTPGGRIGITNYDALRDDTPSGDLAGLILDESSMLKSHYGKWGQVCLRLGSGVPWKLALTGTPAPNDRIEYANHAVFVDAFPNVNSFLAKFFINRGQTSERWELKPHALRPFYKALSHWCIFLTDPSTYGWKDNVHSIPPIHVSIEDVRLSAEQEKAVQQTTGQLFVTELGGITTRSKLSRLAKCESSSKPQYIADLVKTFGSDNAIIWCRYNDEQDVISCLIPQAKSIDGSTPQDERNRLVEWFKGNTCICGGESWESDQTQNTCGLTTSRTGKSGCSLQRLRKNETEGEESGTHQIQRSESCASDKQGRDARTQSERQHSRRTTGSRKSSSTKCLQSRTDDALSAESKTSNLGQGDSTSITATSPESCVASCAHHAITESESSETPRSFSERQSCTCGHIAGGRILISKPKVLGFGLNLQACTRQVFSGLQDSYEEYYQAVKRSNRVGSTKPLMVHIPITDIERPMVENVLRKARRVEADTREQEAMFREATTH